MALLNNDSNALLKGHWGDELKERISKTSGNIKNPFKHMRNWVKSEIYELFALLECISRRTGVESARLKAIERIRSKKETIDKLNQGKFTFKALFKSTGEKAQ